MVPNEDLQANNPAQRAARIPQFNAELHTVYSLLCVYMDQCYIHFYVNRRHGGLGKLP